MLAGLLPGLREIRGPLASGYLWLLFGWLVFEDDVSTAGGAIERLVDLGAVVSPAAVAVAASFAAYLVGSLSEDLFGRTLLTVVRRISRERTRGLRQSWSDKLAPEQIERMITRYENRASRLEAESSLRVAILPPLTAILVYFIIADGWSWAFATLVLPAFYGQAYLRTLEYSITTQSLDELRGHLGLPPASAREAAARRQPGRPVPQ